MLHPFLRISFALYWRNVEKQKSDEKQTDERCEPECVGRNGFPDWAVPHDEVGIHPDKDAGQQSRRILSEMHAPPDVPETIA